jgi:hypothetical protein
MAALVFSLSLSLSLTFLPTTSIALCPWRMTLLSSLSLCVFLCQLGSVLGKYWTHSSAWEETKRRTCPLSSHHPRALHAEHWPLLRHSLAEQATPTATLVLPCPEGSRAFISSAFEHFVDLLLVSLNPTMHLHK